jgi:hypothetical protein
LLVYKNYEKWVNDDWWLSLFGSINSAKKQANMFL